MLEYDKRYFERLAKKTYDFFSHVENKNFNYEEAYSVVAEHFETYRNTDTYPKKSKSRVEALSAEQMASVRIGKRHHLSIQGIFQQLFIDVCTLFLLSKAFNEQQSIESLIPLLIDGMIEIFNSIKRIEDGELCVVDTITKLHKDEKRITTTNIIENLKNRNYTNKICKITEKQFRCPHKKGTMCQVDDKILYLLLDKLVEKNILRVSQKIDKNDEYSIVF